VYRFTLTLRLGVEPGHPALRAVPRRRGALRVTRRATPSAGAHRLGRAMQLEIRVEHAWFQRFSLN
jgi:hypothetical protein